MSSVGVSPSGSSAELAQRLAPFVDDRLEGRLARPVADEPVLVADLEVVAVDLDAGQELGAVRIEHRQLARLFAHEGPKQGAPLTRAAGT